MPNFIMLVGIPGCGKSTYTKDLADKGYSIFSSDAIRDELNMHNPRQSGIIFDIMHKRIKKDMDNGKDIVYDATNMSRKNRVAYLETIKSYTDYKKICYLFIVPIDVCKERNSHREGYAKVPDEVYDKMLCNFQTPMMEEGWDEIVPILYDKDFELDFGDLDKFNQDNHNHALTLGKHMTAATKYLEDNGADEVLIEAAKWHDIGKFYTKKFENYKGEPTTEAHFYNHENYGAYVYLLIWLKNQNIPFEKALEVSQIINWHMAPYIRWGKSTKAYNNDRKLVTEEFINRVNLFHAADEYAH